MTKQRCECSDPGCKFCGGECDCQAVVVLRRVDMDDVSGTAFCDGCQEDAFDSGVFEVAGDDEPLDAGDDDRPYCCEACSHGHACQCYVVGD